VQTQAPLKSAPDHLPGGGASISHRNEIAAEKSPEMGASMQTVIWKTKREDLFQEIFKVLDRWPDLEREVFFQAHYCGQSPEAISRSLKLDSEAASAILKKCNRRLQASLRKFRIGTDQDLLHADT
jgi:DNA-directed RNA polymerase specialized sigma24 family protein